MTRAFVVLALLLGSRAGATQYAFQISFTDKNNTPYSLSTPSSYLSARAISRRTTQGIAIDSTDLPVNARYIDSVLTLTGGILHEKSKWLNACVILVADSSLIHNLDGVSFVSGKKMVAYYGTLLHHKATRNTGNAVLTNSVPVHKTTSSDNGYYSDTWNQTTIVHGNFLYDNGFKGNGKLIAVLDAGFQVADTHPAFDSLRNSGRIVDVHNFTLDTSYVYSYDIHGTEVLSTMAGYAPGIFVGTAPLAEYALYVTEDGNSEQPVELFNMLCGAERADSVGADVITTSLGYNSFDYTPYNFNFLVDFDGKSTLAAKAANLATKKGMLFVASAGNEGGDTWNMILTPGDADSALTIGSVDLTGIAAPTSGFGPNAAGQVKPDVCGLGHTAAVINVYDNGYDGAGDGTSFSTPQIAGWAACLWQANPGATPYRIRQAIIRCASDYLTPGPQVGYGVPDFECTEQVLGVNNISTAAAGSLAVVVSPNPFEGQLDITLHPQINGHVGLHVIDVTGTRCMSTEVSVASGVTSVVPVDLHLLPPGVYLLQVVSSTAVQTIRIIRK